jgi:hypothetical protein
MAAGWQEVGGHGRWQRPFAFPIPKGNRWVERILSLKDTCRLHAVSTYHVLVDAVSSFLYGQQSDLAWLQ